MSEFAMVGVIILCGVIFYFTHDDEDTCYPDDDTIELDGIPIEELD